MKKRVSVLLLAVLLVFGFAACGGRNAVPDFDDWGTHQLGHITVRVPTDRVTEETEVEEGMELISIESTVTGASVVAFQLMDMVQFLREFGIEDEVLLSAALQGSLHGGVTDFLAEAGGRMHGETEGQVNGVPYFGAYGVTDLNDAYFEARAFIYGDDFYLVKFFWNEANADIVEQFFQSIQFGR